MKSLLNLFFLLLLVPSIALSDTNSAGLYIETASGKIFAERKGDFYQINGTGNQKILFTQDQITAYSKNGIIPTEEKLNKNKSDYLASEISKINSLKTDQSSKNTEVSSLLGNYDFTESQKSQITSYLTEHQFDSVKKIDTVSFLQACQKCRKLLKLFQNNQPCCL